MSLMTVQVSAMESCRYSASAASMALCSSGLSGATLLGSSAFTWPSLPSGVVVGRSKNDMGFPFGAAGAAASATASRSGVMVPLSGRALSQLHARVARVDHAHQRELLQHRREEPEELLQQIHVANQAA